MAPLLQGVNDYKILPSTVKEAGRGEIVCTKIRKKRNKKYWVNPLLLKEFNEELKKFDYSRPLQEQKLLIPYLLTTGEYLDWQDIIKQSLLNLNNETLKVYNPKKSEFNFSAFKTKYGLENVFAISGTGHASYIVSESINDNYRVKNGCLN